MAESLERHTVVGSLWRAEGERLRCVACGHRCLIAEGRRGVCRVRFNRGGQLRVPFGYVAALQCDPIEKKPFFHVLPGVDALTFGMLGCDFHCGYCQNWVTSQSLRDPASTSAFGEVSPAQIVQTAKRLGAPFVVSSYNEPLITAEWAAAVFEEARSARLGCAFVSNGNATAEALDFISRLLLAYKVDLKTYSDENYRRLGGHLSHVLETIRMVHARGLWIEIVTLLVPGFNDSEKELRQIAAFIRSVSSDIPWHVTAFHPDYKMTDPRRTEPLDLLRAVQIGSEEGLNYVYAGNAPGRVGELENTRCPNCRAVLIKRHGFVVLENRVGVSGKCPECAAHIPGIWQIPGSPGAAS